MEIKITLPRQQNNQPPSKTQQKGTPNQEALRVTSPQMSQQTRIECLALLNHIDVLQQRLSTLQKNYRGQKKKQAQIPRKHRRKKSQLDKSFKCIVSECPKKYGSITSLKLHLRAKHGMRVKKKRLREELITVNG